MEDVIVFCDKTAAKVSSEISATESELNKKLQQEERQAIHETLKRNDGINRKFLQQKKNKKFNYLKSKPKQYRKPVRFFYASILRKTSKTNIKRNFRKMTFLSESSSERITLSEKLKMTSRSRSKPNNNQARRERSSTSMMPWC